MSLHQQCKSYQLHTHSQALDLARTVTHNGRKHASRATTPKQAPSQSIEPSRRAYVSAQRGNPNGKNRRTYQENEDHSAGISLEDPGNANVQN